MAPEGRVLRIHGLNMHTRCETRVFVTSEPVQFTSSFAHSAVSLHQPSVCGVRRRPFKRGGFGQQGGGNMSRSQGETGRGTARDPVVCQLEGIPSPSWPCTTSQRAGHRSNGSHGIARLVPWWYRRPDFLHFRRHHRASWSLSVP